MVLAQIVKEKARINTLYMNENYWIYRYLGEKSSSLCKYENTGVRILNVRERYLQSRMSI